MANKLEKVRAVIKDTKIIYYKRTNHSEIRIHTQTRIHTYTHTHTHTYIYVYIKEWTQAFMKAEKSNICSQQAGGTEEPKT